MQQTHNLKCVNIEFFRLPCVSLSCIRVKGSQNPEKKRNKIKVLYILAYRKCKFHFEKCNKQRNKEGPKNIVTFLFEFVSKHSGCPPSLVKLVLFYLAESNGF
jgi:hypothetical protein